VVPSKGPPSIREQLAVDPSRRHSAGCGRNQPVDLQLVDNLLDPSQAFQRLLRHLFLKKGADSTVKNDYPGLFLTKNLMPRQVRITFDRQVDPLQQLSGIPIIASYNFHELPSRNTEPLENGAKRTL
jgi:hypothetical protein